jgi:hypothetical protein
VNRDELRSGATAGLLAAGATAGALIALGKRSGAASRPFNIIASHLLGPRVAESFGWNPAVTLTGVVLHITLTTALGVAVLAIVRRKLASLWVASFGLSLLSSLVSVGIARRGLPSLAEVFPVGDLVVYFITLAIALVAGIRFALPSSAAR